MCEELLNVSKAIMLLSTISLVSMIILVLSIISFKCDVVDNVDDKKIKSSCAKEFVNGRWQNIERT